MSAISEQAARQQRLEQLYLEDGRHEPEHPQHGHYTGLVQQAAATTEG